MRERIIRVVERKSSNEIVAEIVETAYEFGTHFVLVLNGHPGFHSVDYERVSVVQEDVL